jgi:cobalt-zinc-cadmium efflux system protein
VSGSHHGHHHGHDHGHHHHAPASYDGAFAIGIGLNLLFVAAEVAAGIFADSIALLADAGHNFSDVVGLLLAWGASWAVRRRPRGRFTFGFRRAPILAALANAALLLVAVGAILFEAVDRLMTLQPVASGAVMAVAGIGIVINGFTAWLFARGAEQDLNVRGAFLHMAADAAVSAGVVLAALLYRQTGWAWADPVAGIAVALVIIWSSWGLMRESLVLAMDAAPSAISLEEVSAFLAAQPGVARIHHLHVWAVSTSEIALTAHLVRPGQGLDDTFLARLSHDLDHRFGIAHATIQVEAGGENCAPQC